ncbi:MAG TPA: peptidoglycan editing factor PgeF [Candidatus Omnitrophota bacterium]|nr:peptidoglycan editing factor PgeF [Candidatus Omnitrophota bacterium]
MSNAHVLEEQHGLIGNLFPHSITMRFSGRADGNMSLTHGDTAGSLDNRRRFLQAAGIDASRLVCARQVHGDAVACVTEADIGRGAADQTEALPDTDALITDRRRVPLAVFTADCLSIFLYDAQQQVIGLAHAGWRGTKENIAGKTVQAMMKHYDCMPENIYAGFGPSIRGCCYRVGEEVAGSFKHGLVRRENTCYLDLVRENIAQLRRREVKHGNIFDCSICTFCGNEQYFSYRREGTACGRAMAVLMIR